LMSQKFKRKINCNHPKNKTARQTEGDYDEENLI